MAVGGLRVASIGRSNVTGLGLTLAFEPSIAISARRIDRLGLDIRSFHEPLKRAIQQVMIPSFKQNFDDGGRPKWTPLSPLTLQARAYRWSNAGSLAPLMVTQALYKTVQHLNIWTIRKTEALIQDLPQEVWYGKVHQTGLLGRKKQVAKVLQTTGLTYSQLESRMQKSGILGVIPARPFLVIQPQDVRDINDVFENWLDERVALAAGHGYFVRKAFHARAL